MLEWIKTILKKKNFKKPLKCQERVASWTKTFIHKFTALTSALISFAITECGLLSVVLYASCDSCWMIKGNPSEQRLKKLLSSHPRLVDFLACINSHPYSLFADVGTFHKEGCLHLSDRNSILTSRRKICPESKVNTMNLLQNSPFLWNIIILL